MTDKKINLILGKHDLSMVVGKDREQIIAAIRDAVAAEREEWQPLLKAAQGVINWTEIAHRPPVKVDELEIGRMVCVRLHALIYLDAAIRARGNK